MKVLLFFWKQIMWYSEVGAKENIRPEKPCGGRGRKKVSRKTQIGNAYGRICDQKSKKAPAGHHDRNV